MKEFKDTQIKGNVWIFLLIGVVIVFVVVGYILKSNNTVDYVNNGISLEEDAKLVPSHPTNIQVTFENNGATLNWLGTGDDRIQHYNLYKKAADSSWVKFAQVAAIADNRGTYDYIDALGSEETIYGVSAINHVGKESTISSSENIK